MPSEIKRIQKLYKTGKLQEETDEKYARGYWELAGEIAVFLASPDDFLMEQLQTGFYQVFQNVLVKKEYYK